MKYNPSLYEYSSRRALVYGKEMVCSSHPLAAQAGFEILKQGGNAIDAAIATAAALTVVEPTSNGIGGDAFAIFVKDGHVHGMNASGRAPRRLNADILRSEGHDTMPTRGPHTLTVPGVPAAWAALSQVHGTLPLEDVLAPAIRYAEEGAPVAVTVGEDWERAYLKFAETPNDYQDWMHTFTVDEKAPAIGHNMLLKHHGQTLRDIAETQGRSFYEGALMKKILRYVQSKGALFTEDDFTSYQPEWVTPIETEYAGYRVLEIPPNGQGMVALMALNILKQRGITSVDSPDAMHVMMEAVKLAFTDGRTWIADGDAMTMSIDDLLSEDYARDRADAITTEAIDPQPIEPIGGGTVYLATADKDGNMVSYIQSNYMGFGSGLVVPETGIALHNRGANFSLDPHSPNVLEGGKRPYHTIIPGFLMQGDRPVGPFGIMGGFMQPQAHVQVLVSLLMEGKNPQAALDRPRFLWTGGKCIDVERDFPEDMVRALKRRGHDISYSNKVPDFGRGQIIIRNEHGIYTGATEKRCDGTIAAG